MKDPLKKEVEILIDENADLIVKAIEKIKSEKNDVTLVTRNGETIKIKRAERKKCIF